MARKMKTSEGPSVPLKGLKVNTGFTAEPREWKRSWKRLDYLTGCRGTITWIDPFIQC